MRGSSIRGMSAVVLIVPLMGLGWPVMGGDRTADVLDYRADPARTGVMPGPGPSGTPVVSWSFQAGAPIVSQVAVARDTVYLVTAVGSVHALDITTGAELWSSSLAAPSRAGATVVDGLVIAASAAGVSALDAQDGGLVWASAEPGSVSGTPVVVHGTVVAASEAGVVSALEATTGSLLWQTALGSAVANSVAADEETGIAVIGGRTGVAVAVDLADGHVRWRYDTQDAARIGTPTIGDGLVYIATLEGGGPGTRHIHAVEATTGKPAWTIGSPGDAPAFAPALADGRAIISAEDGSVSAYDAHTGESLWRYDAPAVVETVAAVADDTVYVASNDGQALALDAATGAEHWRVSIEGIPYGAAVTGGLVLVGTTAGTLYAIGGASGHDQP